MKIERFLALAGLGIILTSGLVIAAPLDFDIFGSSAVAAIVFMGAIIGAYLLLRWIGQFRLPANLRLTVDIDPQSFY